MSSVNKVILVGNLGKDPEQKSFQSGGSVVNLNIATGESWKDKSTGERKERTEWHTVAIFIEQIGDVAMKYLRKGSKVYIEGKLQTRKWQDKDGNDRYSTEVVLQGFDGRLVLLDSRGGDAASDQNTDSGNGSGQGGQSRSGGAFAGDAGTGGFSGDLDDDVPF